MNTTARTDNPKDIGALSDVPPPAGTDKSDKLRDRPDHDRDDEQSKTGIDDV
jgi:hypothetical protein